MYSRDKDPAKSERIWGQYYNAPLEDCFPDRKPGLVNQSLKSKFEYVNSETYDSKSTWFHEEVNTKLESTKDL